MFVARALPDVKLAFGGLSLGLEAVTAARQFGDGLIQQQLLQRPLLDVLVFVLLQLRDVLHCSLQNAAFILLAPRHDLGQLVDAFVYGFAAASLDCGKMLDLLFLQCDLR